MVDQGLTYFVIHKQTKSLTIMTVLIQHHVSRAGLEGTSILNTPVILPIQFTTSNTHTPIYIFTHTHTHTHHTEWLNPPLSMTITCNVYR